MTVIDPNLRLTSPSPTKSKLLGDRVRIGQTGLIEMDIQVEADTSGFTTTTLTGAVDQAALIGMLRQLYYLGFPLISVNCIQSRRNDNA